MSPSYLSHSLLRLSWRLRPRDLALALLLDEHRTLTTPQITSILFTSPRTCRNRLDVLRRLAFIDRAVLNRPGRVLPVHWVPGPLSARYAAMSRGERPPTARALRERQDAVVTTDKLDHLVGANQFFVDLLAHARAHPGTRLARWWSTRHTAAAFGRRIHPDGHGIWHDGDTSVGWYLEFDTGSESHGRLVSKLDLYRGLRADGGPNYPVLFWLPTTARETHLHQRLATVSRTGVTVATATRDAANGAGPAGAVWRLAGNGRHRLRLSQLPSSPGRPGAYNPGPATPEQDPLRLLLPDPNG